MLQLGLRLGDHPRVLVTTTPRPGPDLTRIMATKKCIVTRGSTRANPHLSTAYVETVEDLYAGTRLGRQELDGELLPDAAGALWSVELIERCRLSADIDFNNAVRPELVEGQVARAHASTTPDQVRGRTGGEWHASHCSFHPYRDRRRSAHWRWHVRHCRLRLT